MTNVAKVGSLTLDPKATNNFTPALITSVSNLPPVANGDSYSTPVNTALTMSANGVLANDADANGNTLKALVSATATKGTLVLNTNGGFTYTPTNNYIGLDSFTYRASDGSSTSAVATVSLTITPLADIATTVTGPTNAGAGTNIVYTITVTNIGPLTASNVVASDVLPANVVFVSATGGGTNSKGVITWSLPSAFAAKSKTNFTVTVTTPAGAVWLTNIVSSTAATPDPVVANNNGTAAAAKVITSVAGAAKIALHAVPPRPVFRVKLACPPNTTCALQASTDLRYWQTLLVTNSTSDMIEYLDQDMADNSCRFYRLVVPK